MTIGDLVAYKLHSGSYFHESQRTRYRVVRVESDGYVIIKANGEEWRASAWRLESVAK